MTRFLSCLRQLPLAAHLRVGMQGEGIAVRYLRRREYIVLARNVRLGRDEIDIIAFDSTDRVLVFVEVKARSEKSEEYRPELNLTRSKKGKMRRAARAWVSLHGYEGGWRIDVIFIAGSIVIDHLQEIDDL
jgi:putative endonuclease